ncbi:MAG: FHA domain-containing protein [Chloroflexi bacterium]|nr:FHA domain-containing protein [Chloroflexota bacterium]MCC6892347.1 FHA domain-containing protein [Anaerolineae bacterium]
MMSDRKEPAKTKLLPPVPNETVEHPYRTHIMPRNQTLRRLLAGIPGLSKDADRIAPTKVSLVVRGIAESISLKEGQVALLGRADFRSGGFQPDVDLTAYGAQERGVSRAHARLHLEEGQLYITDLYSANGTRIRGERLEPEQPYMLNHNDEFQLGALFIRVTFE